MLTGHLHALGLESEPFEEGPAGRFFFSTSALTQRLDLLHHLVQYSDLLLAVTGPEGSGRTSVLAKVIESAGDHWRTCPVSVVGNTGINGLLDRVLSGLDVPSRGGLNDPVEQRLTRLAEHLEGMVSAGEVAAIIIDDADQLDEDAVEFVIELALRSANLKARIILAGSASIGQRLQAAASKDAGGDLVHIVELPALSEEQTGDYLHTRLRVAGMQGDTPFAPERVAAIRKESEGRPARINELAAIELVNLATVRHEQAARSRVAGLLMQWWKGLAVIAFALLMIAIAIIVLPSQAPLQGPGALPPLIVDVTDPPDKRANQGGENSSVGMPPGVRTASNAASGVAQEPVIEVLGDPSPQASERGTGLGTSVGAAPSALNDPAPARDQSSDAAPTAQAGRDRAPRDNPKTGQVSPASSAAVPAVSDTAGTADVPVRKVVPRKPVPKPAPKPDKEPAPASSPGPVNTVAWLKRQSPEHFTIQLVGTHDDAAMLRFLRSSRIGSEGAWFRTTHKGKRWYVVVYGVYSTRSQASKVATRLPTRLRPGRPWIRSIGSILDAAR
ncbi:MAG: DamX protein [Gammaproteobacteria bacterium]|jgi:DamX protein